MKKIILASTSFRRQELLKWTGLPFEAIRPDFEEALLPRSSFKSTAQYVEALSYGKGISVKDDYQNALILSGDTVVEIHNKVIGKPRDLAHAREILELLSGQTHIVYSGVSLIDTATGLYLIDSVKSEVTFKKLSDQQIDNYIKSGESLGKAGAYAINMGAKSFVANINGSMTNIIGLPLVKVVQMLREFKVKIPVDIHAVIKQYLDFDE